MLGIRNSSVTYFLVCMLCLEYLGVTVFVLAIHPSTSFTEAIVNKHLGDCYTMNIRKTVLGKLDNQMLNTPIIHTDLGKEDYSRVTNHLNEATRYSLMIKHNRQCIVYHIALIGLTNNDVEKLLSIFQIRVLQIEATFSYLFVEEFDSYEMASNFITSRKLANFQHRLLVVDGQLHGHLIHEVSTNIGFYLRRFCFFCGEGGNPGFLTDEVTYNRSEGVNSLSLSQIFPDMTKHFNGKIMRVTVPPAPPLVLLVPSEIGPEKYKIQGQHANILISLANHFNFTYTLYPAPGGLTGIKLGNGTWNGVMGEILYDRADLGLNVATSYERYKIVDVTVSVFYAFLVLVSTKPKPVFEWQAIFYPFQRNCWLAFIASTIFTFFASKWLHNNAIKYQVPNALRGKGRDEILAQLSKKVMTSYKSFYITVGHLLEQGTPFEFNTTPSRTFVLFWMFFAMIITTAYRSKLFTFLTFPTVEVPPSTFLELAKSTYKWGMKHLGGIAFVFITKSPLQYVRFVGEKMTVYNDKFSCLDRTFTDRFTCIIYKAYIDYMMEVRYWKIRHNFHISDFVTPPVGAAWVLPKYAPWLPEFNRVSYPVYEMGLADKYLYDYQDEIAKDFRAQTQISNSTHDTFELNTNYKGDDDGSPKPLVLANMYAAFLILIFGTCVSCLVLGVEIMRKKALQQGIKKRRRRIHLLRVMRRRRRNPGISATF